MRSFFFGNHLPAALLAVLAVLLASCSHVAPYEREYLTKPGMDGERDARGAAFEAHVQNAREAAPGGRDLESTGGGCGCN